MKRNAKRKNNKGFSLVELIIVIAIMAILAGILAPQFVKYVNRSKVSSDIQNAQQIASAIAVHYADNPGTAVDEFVPVKKDETIGSDTAKIQDILNGIPGVKVESGSIFAFSVDDKGEVVVAVVKSDATKMPDAGSENILYPNQPTTGKWAQ